MAEVAPIISTKRLNLIVIAVTDLFRKDQPSKG
jgi:hypothetical protein